MEERTGIRDHACRLENRNAASLTGVREVVSFDDLMASGGMTAAKEKGLVRSEGKDYVVKDGDVVLFRFNV